MRGLYSTAIRIYSGAVTLASLFGNEKARLWTKGRKHFPSTSTNDCDDWIWVHAASLGEFEQGRPVIEAIKKEFPQYKILLSFFSPSGYEIRKNYPLADEILYLPSDTLANARKWINRHHFKAAIFIKYEFWYNYIKILKDNQIPLFYISLILRPDQHFFKWFGTWFRNQLKNVTRFYTQDEKTATLLQSTGITKIEVCGDTRFDRVSAIAKQAKRFPDVEKFIHGRKCIIAGSSWQPDEKLLLSYISHLPDDYCLILAPHDISDSHINQIKSQFSNYQLYTQYEAAKDCKILIINTIGILSQLYQYARFVYIGGGFGANIHNIQEPITFGCPVVFGPKYKSFKEAVDLVEQKGAFSIKNESELTTVFERLVYDDDFLAKTSRICKDYVTTQVGATEAIMQGLRKIL
jgi:3-deoxy-D-manno-octulosonic-acid transferase